MHGGRRRSPSLDSALVSTTDPGLSLPFSRGTMNQDCPQSKDGHLVAVLRGERNIWCQTTNPTNTNNTKLATFKTMCEECRKNPRKHNLGYFRVHGTCT